MPKKLKRLPLPPSRAAINSNIVKYKINNIDNCFEGMIVWYWTASPEIFPNQIHCGIEDASKNAQKGFTTVINNVISLDIIINECILSLINEKNTINNKNMEMNMEIINSILIRSGKKFDADKEKKEKLNDLLKNINDTIKELKLSARIKFMFMDLNDLRKKEWHSKK